MSYIKVDNFKPGLDTRRSELTSMPGTLLTLENAHINPGGEIEKRKAYIQYPATPLRTVTADVFSCLDTATFTVMYAQVSGNPSGVFTLADVGKTVATTWGGEPDGFGYHMAVIIQVHALQGNGKYSQAYLATQDRFWNFSNATTLYIFPTMLGLQSTQAGLLVFGSDAAPAGLPQGVTYQQLICPIDPSYNLYNIVTSCNFGGKAWVVAQFANPNDPQYPSGFSGLDFVFYDGQPLGEWWEGYLITRSSFLQRMYALLDSDAATATLTAGPLVIGTYYTITNYVAGDDFTNVSGITITNATGQSFIATGTAPTTWSHGSTLVSTTGLSGFHVKNVAIAGGEIVSFDVNSEYGVVFTFVADVVAGTTTGYTAVKSYGSTPPVTGYGATAQFKFTGGQAGTAVGIASFTIANPAVFTTVAAHGFVVGDWVTITGMSTANTALNGTFYVAVVGTTTSFSLKTYPAGATVSAVGLTTQTASVYRSAGLLRLQVVTPNAVVHELIGTSSGTVPIMMPLTSGDGTNDINLFAGVITGLINAFQSGWTAQNNGAQISLYADPTTGTAGNNALVKIIGVNDLTFDTVSFVISLANTVSTEQCTAVRAILNGASTTLFSGTISGTASSLALATANDTATMAKAIANAIEANKGTSGYTAAYLRQLGTGSPTPISDTVIVSAVSRSSGDTSPSRIEVDMTSTTVAPGGYAGDNVFPAALKVTTTDYIVPAQTNFDTWTLPISAVIAGGLSPISLVSFVNDYSLLIWTTFAGPTKTGWKDVTATYANGQFTIVFPVEPTGPLWKGLYRYTAVFKDASPVPNYATVVGNVYFLY